MLFLNQFPNAKADLFSEEVKFTEKPVEILDRKEKVLRNKVVNLVKVLWKNQKVEEATWEREDDMRSRYPHLFA